jgi:hypothetical protein
MANLEIQLTHAPFTKNTSYIVIFFKKNSMYISIMYVRERANVGVTVWLPPASVRRIVEQLATGLQRLQLQSSFSGM